MKKTRFEWSDIHPRGMDPRQWILGHGIDISAAHGIDAQLNFDPDLNSIETHIKEIRRILFVNQGWRLSKAGLNLFRKIYNTYDSTHPDNRILTGRVMVRMDAAAAGPWGYSGDTITVFDPTVHFELSMVNGSVQRLVEIKNPD